MASHDDPFLTGYGDAYQGYGGNAPNFNRFTSITSPPAANADQKGPQMPKLGRGWFHNAGALKDINYHLLISKIFYFFFYSAFGSLFPLIAVYFKQLGMNPSQTGALIGFRPFVEFISAPFFGNLADKYKIWKQILLFSIFCWIAFTLGLAFVKPPPHACLTANATHIIMVPPRTKEAMRIDPDKEPNRKKRSLENLEGYDLGWNINKNRFGQMGEDAKRSSSLEDTGNNDPDFFLGAKRAYNEGYEKIQNEDEFALEGYMPRSQSRSKRSKPDIELDASGELDVNDIDKNLPENNVATKILNFHELFPHPKIVIYGKSPLPLDHTKIANVDEKMVEGLVSPPFSSIVFKSSDVQKMFWLILFLMMIGEFFSAPAITLADTATLGFLEDDVESYGKQRLFGSLGWGIAMLIVGISLDQADVFADHPCGYKQPIERNYMVCFAIFTVFMICAFLSATRMKFKDGDDFNKESIKLKHLKGMKDKIVGKVKDAYDSHMGYVRPQTGEGQTDQTLDEQGKPVQIKLNGQGQDMVTDTHTVDSVGEVTTTANRPTPFVPRGMPGQAGTLPHWTIVTKHFANVKLGSMLFLTWFMGFGVGLVFTFLFWHLHDLHGTPTLFGIASVINHVSEIFAYFFSKKLINKIGHVKVLYLGLLGNVARFLYVSFLRSPWPVLPFELLQGLTHAAVWAACCSYVTQSTPTEYRATAQGILQGVHHGLGRGCGAVIGGILVYFYGTENVFRGYGITCIFVFVGYVALNFFYIRKHGTEGPSNDWEEPKEFLEEGTHLAPCGVPMGINRNLSSTRLDDVNQQQQQPYMGGSKQIQNGSYAQGQGQGQNIVMPRAPHPNTDAQFQQPDMDPRQQQGYGYGDDDIVWRR